MRRLVALAAIALSACNATRAGPTEEEMTIVVQGDSRELAAQEKALQMREEQLRAEQSQLDQRIAELARGRAHADADERRKLETELARTRVAQTEVAAALQRSKLPSIDSLESNPAVIAAREANLAERERRLAMREGDLTAREKEIAQREKTVAMREAEEGRLVGPGLDPASRRDVLTRGALEARHRKLLAELDQRGILVSDLQPEAQPLNAEIFAARKAGDLARATDLLAELSRAVARLKVDQRFVESKMVRLQQIRGQSNLPDGSRSEVERLLREVTGSYSDGHYEQANKGLNRISAILDASAGSG